MNNATKKNEINSFDESGMYTKIDNRTVRFYNTAMNVLNILALFILYTIIAAILFEIGGLVFKPFADDFPRFALFFHTEAVHDSSEAILKIIELLFLSTIPLLITTSFYKYYKNVIKSVFVKTNLMENERMVETLKSSVDLSMTKYTFFSILVSTGFIIMLRRINVDGEIENGKIVLYGLTLIGIVAMLLFILKIKHSIVESAIKAIEAEKNVDLDNETERRKTHIAELNREIGVLQNSKQQVQTEIKDLEEELKAIRKRIDSPNPDDDGISGIS